MAVTSSHLLDDWCDLADRKFTYGAKYRVKTNDREDPALEVLIGAALATPDPVPSYFATFALNGSSDPNAFAQTFSPRRVATGEEGAAGMTWEITVGWAPMENPDDDWTTGENPLTRQVRIDDYSEEIEEIVEQGWVEVALPGAGGGLDVGDFHPICNSAGQQPDAPLTRPRRLTGLKFTINVATLSAAKALQAAFENKLNDATFYGGAEKTVLCRSIEISAEMLAGGVSYREVSICVLFREEGWAVPLVNRGYKHLMDLPGVLFASEEPTVTKLVEAVVWNRDQKRNVPAAEPVNLDGDGYLLPEGALGTVAPWRVNDLADFSGMGVGT